MALHMFNEDDIAFWRAICKIPLAALVFDLAKALESYLASARGSRHCAAWLPSLAASPHAA